MSRTTRRINNTLARHTREVLTCPRCESTHSRLVDRIGWWWCAVCGSTHQR